MAKTTVIIGLILVAIGLVAYFGSEPKPLIQEDNVQQGDSTVRTKLPITALIPAFFGLPLVACGLLAFKDAWIAHAMHAAACIGLLGSLGGLSNAARGILKDEPNYRAVSYSFLMGLICTVFVGLCVQSFIQARKRRRQQGNHDASAVGNAEGTTP